MIACVATLVLVLRGEPELVWAVPKYPPAVYVLHDFICWPPFRPLLEAKHGD